MEIDFPNKVERIRKASIKSLAAIDSDPRRVYPKFRYKQLKRLQLTNVHGLHLQRGRSSDRWRIWRPNVLGLEARHVSVPLPKKICDNNSTCKLTIPFQIYKLERMRRHSSPNLLNRLLNIERLAIHSHIISIDLTLPRYPRHITRIHLEVDNFCFTRECRLDFAIENSPCHFGLITDRFKSEMIGECLANERVRSVRSDKIFCPYESLIDFFLTVNVRGEVTAR